MRPTLPTRHVKRACVRAFKPGHIFRRHPRCISSAQNTSTAVETAIAATESGSDVAGKSGNVQNVVQQSDAAAQNTKSEQEFAAKTNAVRKTDRFEESVNSAGDVAAEKSSNAALKCTTMKGLELLLARTKDCSAELAVAIFQRALSFREQEPPRHRVKEFFHVVEDTFGKRGLRSIRASVELLNLYVEYGRTPPRLLQRKLLDVVTVALRTQPDVLSLRHCAYIGRAVAELRLYDEDLMTRLCKAAISSLGQPMDSEEAAENLVVSGTVLVKPVRKPPTAAEKKLTAPVEAPTATSVCVLTTALATCRHVDREWLEASEEVLISGMSSCKPSELAYALRSCAVLGWYSPRLYDAVCSYVLANISSFRARHLAHLCWACCVSGHDQQVTLRLLKILLHRSARRLSTETFTQLFQVISYLAASQHTHSSTAGPASLSLDSELGATVPRLMVYEVGGVAATAAAQGSVAAAAQGAAAASTAATISLDQAVQPTVNSTTASPSLNPAVPDAGPGAVAYHAASDTSTASVSAPASTSASAPASTSASTSASAWSPATSTSSVAGPTAGVVVYQMTSDTATASASPPLTSTHAAPTAGVLVYQMASGSATAPASQSSMSTNAGPAAGVVVYQMNSDAATGSASPPPVSTNPAPRAGVVVYQLTSSTPDTATASASASASPVGTNAGPAAGVVVYQMSGEAAAEVASPSSGATRPVTSPAAGVVVHQVTSNPATVSASSSPLHRNTGPAAGVVVYQMSGNAATPAASRAREVTSPVTAPTAGVVVYQVADNTAPAAQLVDTSSESRRTRRRGNRAKGSIDADSNPAPPAAAASATDHGDALIVVDPESHQQEGSAEGQDGPHASNADTAGSDQREGGRYVWPRARKTLVGRPVTRGGDGEGQAVELDLVEWLTMQAASLQLHIPANLCEACCRWWLKLLDSSKSSKTQGYVAAALATTHSAVWSEATVHPGLVAVDLLVLLDDGSAAMIEVDGPQHYSANQPRVPLGTTTFRHNCFKAMLPDVKLVIVPYYEWDAVQEKGGIEFLSNKLKTP